MALGNMKKSRDHVIITSEQGVGTWVKMTVMNFQKKLHPDLAPFTL